MSGWTLVVSLRAFDEPSLPSCSGNGRYVRDKNSRQRRTHQRQSKLRGKPSLSTYDSPPLTIVSPKYSHGLFTGPRRALQRRSSTTRSRPVFRQEVLRPAVRLSLVVVRLIWASEGIRVEVFEWYVIIRSVRRVVG